ncbi:AAA family ATPase [Desulfonema magnum]|uniref:AAA ATPase-like domain-containing protein n=1 Tax=Desulfonema magnum TaxID=45655 RepID=A0A975BI14_9BACT|nr:AAA family ATPase [Desulfonema magnum]QTA85420.1 AAA ATPase-like domain-containing protein [Desulfonema magnum]
MPKDRIIIRNFGPIRHVNIELPDIVVFIGRQAAGKSAIAKLIHFFRFVTDDAPFSHDLMDIFRKFFFGDVWLRQSQDAEIAYLCGNGVKFSFKNNELTHTDMKKSPRRSVFIPAGRAVYSLVSDAMFGLSLESVNIDPGILLFGRTIETMKSDDPFEKDPHLRALSNDILKGKFRFSGNENRIYFSENRYVTMNNASSGQQEVFPVLLLLAAAMASRKNHCITIEEPEAHLYPYAQHKLVEFITRVHNSPHASNTFVITTHSPYILTSFNNLLFAHQVAGISEKAGKAVEAVVPEPNRVNPEDFSAYYVEDGKVRSVFDEGLISDNEIDDASEDIAEVFDQLIDIYKGFGHGQDT